LFAFAEILDRLKDAGGKWLENLVDPHHCLCARLNIPGRRTLAPRHRWKIQPFHRSPPSWSVGDFCLHALLDRLDRWLRAGIGFYNYSNYNCPITK
jgi:hypothetical protein